MQDNDLMERINKLLKQNQNLVKKSKSSVLNKEREEMDTKLEKEHKVMGEFLETCSTSLNDNERAAWDDIQKKNKNLLDLYVKKIQELDTEQPDYEQKAHKLYQLAKNSVTKQTEDLESLNYDATRRNMDETKATFTETLLFNAARTSRLNERKKILDSDKQLYLKEQDNLKKDQSSLIDDFANVNLEQPSYMDPDD